MYSLGNSRVVKNDSNNDNARFLPSSFMPLRIFLIIGGNIEGSMFRSLVCSL